jgi:hypothetical protein
VLAAETMALCHRIGARRIEIRGARSNEWQSEMPIDISSGFHHHFIDLNQPLADLRKSFSKGIRYNISRAIRKGIEVEEESSAEALETFSVLHAKGRHRLHLPEYLPRFFPAMFRHLPKDSISLLVARKQGNVVGGLLELQFGDMAIYEQVADARDGRVDGVNSLMLWTSIQRAVESGRRVYSLGRTAVTNQGLRQFKRSWGASEEPLLNLTIRSTTEKKRRLRRKKFIDPRAIKWLAGMMPGQLASLGSRIFYRHWA